MKINGRKNDGYNIQGKVYYSMSKFNKYIYIWSLPLWEKERETMHCNHSEGLVLHSLLFSLLFCHILLNSLSVYYYFFIKSRNLLCFHETRLITVCSLNVIYIKWMDFSLPISCFHYDRWQGIWLCAPVIKLPKDSIQSAIISHHLWLKVIPGQKFNEVTCWKEL